MEIELRAKLENGQKLLDSFMGDSRFNLKSKSDEKDVYFKITSDPERKLVVRIRYSNGSTMLTFKAKATGADTAWKDVDTVLDDPETLTSILLSCGFEQLVVIEKHRASFSFENFEVNIDSIKDLGWFIEVEGRGDDDAREQVETDIKAFLNSIGITESDIVTKGYVPLKLASEGK